MTDRIVALLFTDVVGSTALLDRLGDEAFDAFRRRHFRNLREQVAAHGGTEVKSLGDGLMVVLPSAVQAIECAVALQRQSAASDGVAIRVGVHVGEPFLDEDDYFGTPVVVARRLCDQAGPGQIYASALVRELVGGRRDFEFESVGELELKGLSTPVPAYEISYMRESRSCLPPPLAELAAEPFVGREPAVEELTQLWKEAAEGAVRLGLVAGEPGIGKTRLAAAVAAGVVRGATVLYGRADEDNLVPYQPFVEA
ncbi:MAG: adenylate/guanylate cyclase domain-containing protein, partial [Acidimicrobiia bacterium]